MEHKAVKALLSETKQHNVEHVTNALKQIQYNTLIYIVSFFRSSLLNAQRPLLMKHKLLHVLLQFYEYEATCQELLLKAIVWTPLI